MRRPRSVSHGLPTCASRWGGLKLGIEGDIEKSRKTREWDFCLISLDHLSCAESALVNSLDF